MSNVATETGLARRLIRVRGIVQGVGFRPFVHRLATTFHLSGHVLNSSAGVVIEVEGACGDLDGMVQALRSEQPPLSRIDAIEVSELEWHGQTGFTILKSVPEEGAYVLVSPDVGTCADCRREIADRNDRRFGYPFTNCTNCGPRYTIVLDVPYDRPMTTMAPFAMCEACRAEYDDPDDRRFHAQPNGCAACGPALALVDCIDGQAGATARFDRPADEVLREVRALLHAGAVVAIRGLGGFQLACDATKGEAVQRLRDGKRRSDKPFALMAPDVEAIEPFCEVSDEDRALLESRERPIVILPLRPAMSEADGDGTGIVRAITAPDHRALPASRPDRRSLPDALAPGNTTLGFMLPVTPLHHLLFGEPGGPRQFGVLVMTSGNLSDEPIVTANEAAIEQLQGVAGAFLLHNREIAMRVDDSVVRNFEGRSRTLRRSRSFAPSPIDLGRSVPELLACGAELKNTFCLTKGSHAFLSQHIGDLKNYETLQFFQEVLARMKAMFRVSPRAVAHDLHPDYMSTRLALEMEGVERIAVQHHHAHIASCMAENALTGRVIGVAMDGTGYGTDGAIWGAEFLSAELATFERRAHFRYVPLAGGDAAIRQPWRSALAYLRDAFGTSAGQEELALFRVVPPSELRLVETMLERGIHTIPTSSCGRLFDAVASLTGIRQQINFEGQAAIELEMLARGKTAERPYAFDLCASTPLQVDFRPMIREIVEEVARGASTAAISARFHATIATVIEQVSLLIRQGEALNRVCLSGGVFQNWLLLELTVARLRRQGFEVFLHHQVPPNDGGISLGQAAVATAHLQRGS